MANQFLELAVLKPLIIKDSMASLFPNISNDVDEFLTALYTSRLLGPEHGVPPSLETPVLVPWRWFQGSSPNIFGVRALHDHLLKSLLISIISIGANMKTYAIIDISNDFLH
jgi:hypothetical protein